MTDLAAHNRLWADLLVDELVRQGVGAFAVCPGSRSTPLTAAVARSGAPHVVHVDERGAAFYALGHARATGRAAAVVTTSGTAVANLFPALVEARMDGVPLLVLTADRPPEARFTHANQTVDQVKIFGDAVVWAYEPPAPTPDVDPAVMLTTAAAAVRHATHAGGGPVHLNLPFREPLTSTAPLLPVPPHLVGWKASGLPYTTNVTPAAFVNAAPLVEAIEGIERGIVLVGEGGDAFQASLLADRLGWPVLPDVRSGARLGPQPLHAAPFYDLALASGAFAAHARPEAVVQVGTLPVSKRLLNLLTTHPPRVWVVVHPSADRIDPAHRVTHRVVADPARFVSDLVNALDPRPHGDWLDAWTRASRTAESQFIDLYDHDDALTEPGVVRRVVQTLPEGEPLVVAASMPVRDLDQAGPTDARSSFVVSNRGASGIDGTVATAAGVAAGTGRGATLLIGDLALLHDLNSLMLLRTGPRVVVVAVNNDGGGIFSFLPVAEHAPEVFERYFGTPHGLSFKAAAEMFGLDYWEVDAAVGLEAALRFAHAQEGSTLIEVRTDRAENRAVHARALARIVEVVDALFPGDTAAAPRPVKQPE